MRFTRNPWILDEGSDQTQITKTLSGSRHTVVKDTPENEEISSI